MIGVDEAELHMLANMYVVEPCLFYTRRWGLSLSTCHASWGAVMPYGVFKCIKTFFLLLSRIITTEKATRAFACMHVESRIAGSPNPVS